MTKNDSKQLRYIPAVGLCSVCVYKKIISTDRSSLFWFCKAAVFNKTLSRYPSLPRLECVDFEDVRVINANTNDS